MESGSAFYAGEGLHIDPKWLIDPKLLFVGPRIGEGAHAKVYEGKYKNQNVAIKIVHKGDTPEEMAKRQGRFLREVTMLSRVQHKNLVNFIGACLEPVMVVVTELLVGGSLRKYLVALRPRSLEPRVAVGFALDIARAMECLHAHGIIHRDLKPGFLPVCWIQIRRSTNLTGTLNSHHPFMDLPPTNTSYHMLSITWPVTSLMQTAMHI